MYALFPHTKHTNKPPVHQLVTHLLHGRLEDLVVVVGAAGAATVPVATAILIAAVDVHGVEQRRMRVQRCRADRRRVHHDAGSLGGKVADVSSRLEYIECGGTHV